MSRPALAAAVLLSAIAAWLSQATLATATSDGPRIALLPLSPLAAIVVVAVAGAVVLAARAGLSLAPVWLVSLLLLPWLPFEVPTAFLMWSGEIRWLVWFAVAILMLEPVATRTLSRFARERRQAWLVTRPRLSAGVLAFAIFAWSAWQVSPSIPGGDEPHYLVIAQSLLLDRDLKIENNHRRGDYQAYFGGPLAPHYIQRGRDGEIYSIHAPGLAAIVAPAFALAGYRGVVMFLLAVSACGSALAWHLAWLATRRTGAAWFGWAAVTTSTTAIFHSFTVYPDGLGGVIVLVGIWALFRAAEERTTGETRLRPWFLFGAALAMLPWMHSRFALLAGSLGALVLLRLPATKNPAGKAVAFLCVPAVSAIAWIVSFLVIYGRPDPSAPYGTTRDFSIAFVPGGLTGLLFDQRFGLVANAPVLLFGFGGLLLMLLRRRSQPTETGLGDRRMALELLFVLVPYLVTATSYAMWWAGWSAPARFANPAVFALAIPCAVLWTTSRSRATKAIAAGALAFGVWLSFALVSIDGGRLAYNTRETTALWLDWASRLTALGEGLPVWYRGREAPFARDVALWAAAMVVASAVARWLASRASFAGRARYGTVVAAVFAIAAMAVTSTVWAVHGTGGAMTAPAQFDLLRRAGREGGTIAVRVAPPRVLSAQSAVSMMRIESATRAAPGGAGLGRNESSLVNFPSVPAGRYRVRVTARAAGGWLLLGVGQDQFALRSAPLADLAAPIELDLPVDVRAIVARGDEEARRSIRSVALEPLAIVGADERLTDRVARRAVNYERAAVFFLDEGSFPEPDAFWIGGGRQASFVVQPAAPATSVDVVLRNAPVANRVTVESGRWREEFDLAAGEERPLQIPMGTGGRAALVTVTSRSGFRPSEVDPTSRDLRFLGVWIGVSK